LQVRNTKLSTVTISSAHTYLPYIVPVLCRYATQSFPRLQYPVHTHIYLIYYPFFAGTQPKAFHGYYIQCTHKSILCSTRSLQVRNTKLSTVTISSAHTSYIVPVLCRYATQSFPRLQYPVHTHIYLIYYPFFAGTPAKAFHGYYIQCTHISILCSTRSLQVRNTKLSTVTISSAHTYLI